MTESCDNCRFMKVIEGTQNLAKKELCCRYAPRPDTDTGIRPLVFVPMARWCGEWELKK
jgi:hypothetical protein